MASGMTIKKINEQDNLYYYKVITYGSVPFDFYIIIDRDQQKVIYYKNDQFNSPLGSMEVKEGSTFVNIPEIAPWVARRVAIQAFMALRLNKLSDDIGFYS